MSKLYSDLAAVYEAMYATFINYEEEYKFYSELLKNKSKNSVLEIGSGTGNLTTHFEKNGFKYYGLDLSKEMLEIAKKKNPDSAFIQGDMRSFKLESLVESIIITGRTISYLLSNEDVISTFKSVHDNLEKGGLFCFDIIDANRFIPEALKGKEITHEATYQKVNYIRKSIWNINLTQGMNFKWDSIYYKKEGTKLIKIGKDSSMVRTFSKDEIEIFLRVNGFTIKEIIDKESYAFPTYVFVAEKN